MLGWWRGWKSRQMWRWHVRNRDGKSCSWNRASGIWHEDDEAFYCVCCVTQCSSWTTSQASLHLMPSDESHPFLLFCRWWFSKSLLRAQYSSSCLCGRSLVAWRGGGRAWSLVLTQTDPNSRRPILTYRAIHKTQCYTTAEEVCCCNLKEISHVITLMEQNCCWMFKYSADDSQRQPMKRCISQPLSLKKEICCNIRLSSRWVH